MVPYDIQICMPYFMLGPIKWFRGYVPFFEISCSCILIQRKFVSSATKREQGLNSSQSVVTLYQFCAYFLVNYSIGSYIGLLTFSVSRFLLSFFSILNVFFCNLTMENQNVQVNLYLCEIQNKMSASQLKNGIIGQIDMLIVQTSYKLKNSDIYNYI